MVSHLIHIGTRAFAHKIYPSPYGLEHIDNSHMIKISLIQRLLFDVLKKVY